MSNRKRGPKLELKLNLSPTRSSSQDVGLTTSPNSSLGSSVASSTDPATDSEMSSVGLNMVLVGCPRCLMFVMLPEADPRCPQCKSTILLDFVSGDVLGPTAAAKKGPPC